MREGTIHKQLCEYFSNDVKFLIFFFNLKKFFILGLFSSRHKEPYDLFSVDYKFLYYGNYKEEDLNPMKTCKLRIKNLINTSQVIKI